MLTFQPQYRLQGVTTWTDWGAALPSSATSVVIGANPPGPSLLATTAYDFRIIAADDFGSTPSNIASTTTIVGVTIQSISLSSHTFAGGSIDGTHIATVTVAMSSGTFSGTIAVAGTNSASFQVANVGGVYFLETKGTVAAGTYSINLVATQAGAVNSPFSGPTELLSSTVTIQSITLNPASPTFTVGTPAGTQIAAVTVNLNSGTFAGTLSVTPSAFFQTPTATSLQIADSPTANNYSVVITASGSGLTNSGFSQSFTVLAVNPNISSVALNGTSFSSGVNNAFVGTINVAMSVGTFAGTYAVSDTTNFQIINTNQVATRGTLAGAGPFPLTVSATDTVTNQTVSSIAYSITPISINTTTTFNRILLDNASFAANTNNATVGNISAAMNNGTFGGTFQITGGYHGGGSTGTSSFQIVNGNQLQCVGTLPAGTYDVVVAGKQPGIANNPCATHFMIIGGTGGGCLTDINLNVSTLAGGAASGTVVGTLSTTMSGGATFSGTYVLSGTQAISALSGQNTGFRVVNGNQVQYFSSVGTPAAPGKYSVGVTATQAGVPNSPYGRRIQITVTGTPGFWLAPPPPAAAVGYNTLLWGDDFTFFNPCPGYATTPGFTWYADHGRQINGSNWPNIVASHPTWTAGDANMQANGVTGPGAAPSPAGGIVTCLLGSGNDSMNSFCPGQYGTTNWFNTAMDGMMRKMYIEAYIQYNHTTMLAKAVAGTLRGWPAVWSWNVESLTGSGYNSGSLFYGGTQAWGHAECDFFENASFPPEWTNLGGPGTGSQRPLGGFQPNASTFPGTTQYGGFNNQWHAIGYRWTDGQVDIFWDNIKVFTGTGLYQHYEDCWNQFIMIGSGDTSDPTQVVPMSCDYIRAWVAP